MRLTTFIVLAVFSLGLNAAGKSAFINSKALLEKSPQAIAANTELRNQFGEREQGLRKLAVSIQEMEKTYQTDSAIMSAEQKKKAEENLIQNRQRFQFEQKLLKDDVQSKQLELLKKVRESITTVIKAYGKQHGYDFIFTDTNVAYASEAVDITEEILKELQKQ